MDQTVSEKVRCAVHNLSGTRCKRNTIVYANFCWQHARKEVGVKIEESKIDHAGRGLFAARNLPANTRISYARPQDFLTAAQLTARYGDGLAQYGICNPAETICADARSTQSGLGRWVNHRPPRKNAKLTLGVRNHRRFANVTLTKNVPANREIYVTYGPHYWIHNQPKQG
jgi:hypothetical protein